MNPYITFTINRRVLLILLVMFGYWGTFAGARWYYYKKGQRDAINAVLSLLDQDKSQIIPPGPSF